MGPLGDGGLQGLRRPWGPLVGRDALLYIILDKSRGGMLHPLVQASQCIPLFPNKELQKRGCVKDFSGGGLIRSLQVVRR